MKVKKQFTLGILAGVALVSLMSTKAMAGVDLTSDGSVNFFGDFRLRAERDDSTKADGSERDRERFRYRARLGVRYKPANKWTAVLRMATNADGLNSPHEDFGTAQTDKKEFGVDQAYLAYNITKELILVAGKTALPFWQSSETWWDKDINPEALGTVYKKNNFSVGGAYATVVEGGWGDDVDLFVYQGTYQTKLGEVKAKFGFGGAELDNVADIYNAENFNMFNGEFKVNKFRFGFEYIVSDADAEDTAIVAEIRYKFSDTWGVRLYRFDVEAFSTLGDGTFGQDDFPNPGNTGVSNFEGYRFQLDYKVSKKINIDLRYFDMERIKDKTLLAATVSDAIFNEKERSRLQLNINMRF